MGNTRKIYIGVDHKTNRCVTSPYLSKGKLVADSLELELDGAIIDIIEVTSRVPYFKDLLKHAVG